ncbi:hypothetical protein BDEG_20349, partial [Batrachochytrium dendrobatidis JEL423]
MKLNCIRQASVSGASRPFYRYALATSIHFKTGVSNVSFAQTGTAFTRLCLAMFTANQQGFHSCSTNQLNSSTKPSSECHYALLKNRMVLRLEGSDAAIFLQGLVTNHITDSMPENSLKLAAFLNAQGRVLMDAFIYREPKNPESTGPSFLVECADTVIPLLEKHLQRYKLRKQVKITNISDSVDVWQIWGSLDRDQLKNSDGGMWCADPRNADMGMRGIALKTCQTLLPDQMKKVPFTDYVARRICLGIPEGPTDFFYEKSLPLESNLELIQGVDFQKGCYLGQELTIRTYHTGFTRKRIVPVQLYNEHDPVPKSLSLDTSITMEHPPSQSDIKLGDLTSEETTLTRSKGVVGKYCGGLHNIGLALVRLESVVRPLENQSMPGSSDLSSNEIKPLILANGMRARAFAPLWWPSIART